MHLKKPSLPHSGAKILFNYRHRNVAKKAYINMHIKEYLDRSLLCKWSITGRIFFSANDDRALERRHHMVHLNPILFGAFQFDRCGGKV